jgi:ABC-type phosphate transport system substrate-binding protein
MVNYKPTIVPFAFYANNDLVGASPEAVENNLSRPQAVNLFSGKIATWDELAQFSSYPKYVQLCLRHAGSGTHATLDKVVFRDDTRSNMVTIPSTDPAYGRIDNAAHQIQDLSVVREQQTSSAPYIYFYQSSSKAAPEAGMKECVMTNGGRGRLGNTVAIGYMDADAADNNDMHQMTFQGVPAVDKVAMAEGVTNNFINTGSYDFWSAQNVYVKNNTTDNNATVQALMTFAETKIPDTKYGIWTSKGDLLISKDKDTYLPKN